MRAHASRFGLTALFAAAVLLCLLPSALAGDAAYCVTCKNPDQTYLCRVTGDAVTHSDAAKLYCVVRTAKEGGHASCGAREATADCHGEEKIYSYSGSAIPDDIAEDPRVKKVLGRIERDQKAFDRRDHRKSLVEVTGNAFSASRRGWRNMRASIAGRDEETQYSPNGAPSGAAKDLPEMPHGTPVIPLSAAHDGAAPLEHRSRVGSFARDTYRCVRSLFRRCGSEADAQVPN